MIKKLRCKYYNKRITTRVIGNAQFLDQEESKLNNTINVNSGAHAPRDNKITKNAFNKNNVATIKNK